MSVRFTVLLPVHRPPALLPFAIESVLAQTLADFELFVVCDGAPAETVACAQGYADRDPRVRVFPFPKGERFGEAHRDAALRQAAGEYVAHIADDDLWLPNFLEEMAALLREADFGNLLHVHVHPDGRIEAVACDLAKPALRQRMLDEKFNLFGLSFGGYRLQAYRRLPEGWSPAPASIWTDLHMWRKFLAREDMIFSTRMEIAGLCFLAPLRKEMSLAERVAENRRWSQQIQDEGERTRIVESAWRSIVERALNGEEELMTVTRARELERQAFYQSASWRVAAPLRRISSRLRSWARFFLRADRR
jgi:glycosyltransferase involved in cell wall biosynthesis